MQQQQRRGWMPPFKTISAITSERGVAEAMRGFSACVVREAIYTAGYLDTSAHRQGVPRREPRAR